MARFSTFYCRCSYVVFISLIFNFHLLFAQGNCLIYPEDSGERKACELSYKAIEYRQGSKESQLLFDEAIRVGPKYAWAYYEKSVPFFKRGLFAEGVSLINKAIELDPKNYLFYRAYWYFYYRSYELSIRDIEDLYTNHKTTFTTTPGGELEMRLLLAMAHAHTGNVQRGIDWIINMMDSFKDQPHLKGIYDHFCLGVLYFKNKQYDLAEAEFEKQLEIDSKFADTYYYLGLLKEKESNRKMANDYFKQSLDKMEGLNGGYSANIFTEFNTYKEDLEKKLQN